MMTINDVEKLLKRFRDQEERYRRISDCAGSLNMKIAMATHSTSTLSKHADNRFVNYSSRDDYTAFSIFDFPANTEARKAMYRAWEMFVDEEYEKLKDLADQIEQAGMECPTIFPPRHHSASTESV